MKIIKGFIGTLVGTVLGGEVIRQVGGTTGLSSGFKSITQSFVGLGVVGNAAKNTKDVFKFR